MPLLTVDRDKCTRDGRCVAECPAKIIEIKEKDAFPTLVENGRELCISCGHCVAVCPQGAMAHERMSAAQCPPVPEGWQLNPELVGNLLRCRRSVRTYRSRPVDRGVLSALIDIARHAPSGHNLQPVHWLVICDSARINALAALVIDWMRHLIDENAPLAAALHMERAVAAWEAGTDRILRGAPDLVLAHAPREDRTAPAACTIALSYIEISAAAYGLGACWAGYLNAAANAWPPVADALALPPDHATFGALMVGYPRYAYHRVPLRNPARVTWR